MTLDKVYTTSLDARARETRILILEPASHFGSRLAASLEIVSLDSLPQYDALSYAWGDANNRRSIFLDSFETTITANLHEALVQLRSEGRCRLWVDAVCINQADTFEKNQQVAMLQIIFNRAYEVIAWVGAVSAHEDLREAVTASIQASSTTVDAEFANLLKALLSIRRFCQRPYWHRVWIIQEIVRARRLRVQYGGYFVSWEAFVRKIDQVSQRAIKMHETRWPEEVRYTRELAEDMTSVKTLIDLRDRGAGHQSLIPLIINTWSAKASDARDKIYALVGVTNDGALCVSPANYDPQNTADDVSMEVTLGFLAMHQRAEIVPLLGRGYTGWSHDSTDSSNDTPTWVPRWHALDYRDRYRQLTYFKTLLQDAEIVRWGLASGRMRAAGDSQSSVTQSQGVLKCQVLQVGDICQIRATSKVLLNSKGANRMDRTAWTTGETARDSWDMRTVGWILELFSCRSNQVYGDPPLGKHSDTMASYIQALAAHFLNQPIDLHSHSGSTGPLYKLLWQLRDLLCPETLSQWAALFTHAATSDSCYCSSEEWTESDMDHDMRTTSLAGAPTESSARLVSDLADSVEGMINYGLAIGILDSKYIAWVPEAADLEDRIFILKGSGVPLVARLRPEGGFVVVGDAYVAGIMQGQLVPNVDEVDWIDIELY